MTLTKEEIRVVADRARVYPAGQGHKYFSNHGAVSCGQAANLIRRVRVNLKLG